MEDLKLWHYIMIGTSPLWVYGLLGMLSALVEKAENWGLIPKPDFSSLTDEEIDELWDGADAEEFKLLARRDRGEATEKDMRRLAEIKYYKYL